MRNRSAIEDVATQGSQEANLESKFVYLENSGSLWTKESKKQERDLSMEAYE